MKETVPDIFHGHKFRQTAARGAVLEVLSKSTRPLGASEIHERLPPAIDLATIYRTLTLFLEKKIVHRARGVGDDGWRYALADSASAKPHTHPHFVCDGCGRVECLHTSRIPPSLQRALKSATPNQVAYVEVLAHGQCPQCQAAHPAE
jgi:Fur family transcriptional regulator, ferric uptake regulator